MLTSVTRTKTSPSPSYHPEIANEVELQELLLLDDADALPAGRHFLSTSLCTRYRMRQRKRRYPRSGAAASRRGLVVVAPAGVGDAADSRRGAGGVKGHHGVVAFVTPRQGLDQVPLS